MWKSDLENEELGLPIFQTSGFASTRITNGRKRVNGLIKVIPRKKNLL